jgi:hypothetical protein
VAEGLLEIKLNCLPVGDWRAGNFTQPRSPH